MFEDKTKKTRASDYGIKVFKTPQHLIDVFNEYIVYCDDSSLLANISGFTRYLREKKGMSIARENLYRYQKYDGYGEVLKYINDVLEDTTLNNKTQKDLIKLAYLNNRCGYSQKNEVVQTIQFQLDDDSIAARLSAAGYQFIEHKPLDE